MGHKLALRILAALVLALAPVSLACGQEANSQAGAVVKAPSWQEKRAAQIRDLVAGKLAADVDPASLFSFSLTSRDAERLRTVARLVSDRALFSRASADPSLLAPLPEASARLALAEATFLRLPEGQRKSLITGQRKRFSAQRETARQSQAQEAKLSELRRELQSLEDFLQGKPASAVALRIDGEDFTALTQAAPSPEAEPSADAPIEERIAWLRGQVLLAKRKIFELPAGTLAQMEAKAGLASGAADAIASADAKLDAARSELSEAAQAAAGAASEQERLVANEQATLLQTNRAQAEFRSRLARSRAEPGRIWESALAWRRKVRDLVSGGEDTQERADAAYAELVGELSAVRSRLRAALDSSDTVKAGELEPSRLDPALPEGLPEIQALRQQKEDLSREASRLRAAYADQVWARRRALHDSMILLNEERLGLIPLLSGSRRGAVLGFGAEGVAQVRRELSEIFLEFRYTVQSWQRLLTGLAQPVLNPTPAFVLAILRLILIGLLFSWWRRGGDTLLRRIQNAAAAKRPRTLLSNLQSGFVEYWRRVRQPLDWLILAVLVWWFLPSELSFGALRFVWIILFWSLSTILIVRLVNELARGRGRDDPRAALRWNSLRLIAGSLLIVGLLLNLTKASVGKGAIYDWVYTLAWLLIPVILLLLTHWWRERIVTLAGAEAEKSTLLGWVSSDPEGLPGLLGRMAAGGLLLLKGVQAIVARRVRDLALVREVFEQRARVEAARRVAQDKASGRFHRLPRDAMASLDPHRMPAELRHGEDRPGGLDLPDLRAGTLALIVGERGLGKSAFLGDLAREVGDGLDVIRLGTGTMGLDGILSDLAAALGADAASATPDAMPQFLAAKHESCLIMIDDIQRLIVPAIGGLEAIDRLVSLARASGDNFRWAFTMGDPAWSYVRRARNDRVLFDTVIRLPYWSAAELRALIERRTAQAGIEPDFSAMIDDGVFELGEDLTPEERRKRGYFDRLNAYVNGNPAIALDYWRRSLFLDSASQNVVVRTFDKPAVDRLSALPMSALFVLRAIVQMDVTTAASIRASTDLSLTVVDDALRSLERMEAVACADGSYRIALHWWIEVVRLLQRQNLIVRGVK